MMGPLHPLSPSLPPANVSEILRYAGAKAEDPTLLALLEQAMAEAEPVLSPKLCFRTIPLWETETVLDLGFAQVRSDALRQVLEGCEKAVIFAATLGIGLDRLIARYGRIAPAKALLLQAIGTERIEALCNAFCHDLQKQAEAEHLHTTRRFSPGYGDLPLDLQRDLFRILECPRSIGLTLNESLLMSPSKSVTAIIGLGRSCDVQAESGCALCAKTNCIHRRSL